MGKNRYSNNFKARPDKAQWAQICPAGEYQVFDAPDAAEYGMVPTDMKGVNTVIVGASGSTDGTIMYFVNMCRIDGNEVDQEPYFELYESGSDKSTLYGIFHHANFIGRTEPLTVDILARIAASGSTADTSFTANSDIKHGTLDDLRKQGKIQGMVFTYRQAIKRKGSE